MLVMHNNYTCMKFVDRIEEAKRLKQVLNADKSTFTVCLVIGGVMFLGTNVLN